ncbi:MAG: c-type cytochrome [Verrucomicrobia bacterium]|nr:c-type cytochrome [Verrucomicrobiota bacterium]
MRYFFAAYFLVVVLVVSLLGFRGGLSRKPPVFIFPDMDRQPKLRPEKPDAFFPDGMGSRLPVPGTIARGAPYEDSPVNTGKNQDGSFVEANPLPITAQRMARGQERYQVNCAPCHGAVGDGKGITSKYGLGPIANLHDERIIRQTDGEIFNTITHGSKAGLMLPYGAQVTITDRWAIIAYVRALQLSRYGSVAEVPAELRSTLK